MRDFILSISWDSTLELDDLVQSALFLTASTGSTTDERNGTTTVEAYFDSPAERDGARVAFEGIEVELATAERERRNWLELYQQSLEPLFIGRSFVVAPDIALIPMDAPRHRIVVPQEQAFGTGSHETTSLCIELLEELEVACQRGLDVGSGSGILAIAMHHLGARKVIAFDNDVDAYGALRDNRIRNGVPPERMPLFIGSVESLRGGRFDVITMNIIPEVIIPLLDDVLERVDGVLILSGILIVRRDDIVRECSARGMKLQREKSKGEWWAGQFVRGANLT